MDLFVDDIWVEILAQTNTRDCFRLSYLNRAVNRAFKKWKHELHPYKPNKAPFRAQRDLARAVIDGGKYHLFKHPPGWGKSLASLATALQCGLTLVLAKPGLVQQFEDEFRQALRNPKFSRYDGKKVDAEASIIFASSALRWSNPKHKVFLSLNWKLLIVDEGRSLSHLPIAQFPKVVVLNATARDKDLLDSEGKSMNFTVHESTYEGESIDEGLLYRKTELEIVEIHSDWSNKEAAIDYRKNLAELTEDDWEMNRWGRCITKLPSLEEIRTTWPLYLNRVLHPFVQVTLTEQEIKAHGTVAEHISTTDLITRANIVPPFRPDIILSSLLKPEDRVLYFPDIVNPTIGVDGVQSDKKKERIGDLIFRAVNQWKDSGKQWLSLNGFAGQRGFNVQEANVLVTIGYKQWKQRLGRVLRRGQQQKIVWYVFINNDYESSADALAEATTVRRLTAKDLPVPLFEQK